MNIRPSQPILATLSIDILRLISEYLNPNDLSLLLYQLTRFSEEKTSFSIFVSGGTFDKEQIWKLKMQQHFPDDYAKISEHPLADISWEKIFKSTYQYTYRNLTPRYRYLFTRLKAVNIAELKTANISFAELLFTASGSSESLLQIALRQKNQEVLDHIFRIIASYYARNIGVDFIKVPNIDVSQLELSRVYDNKDILYWAEQCNQIAIFEQVIAGNHNSVYASPSRLQGPLLRLAAQGGDVIALQNRLASFNNSEVSIFSSVPPVDNVSNNKPCGFNAFLGSIASGHLDCAKLLAKFSMIELKALKLAIQYGHLHIVKYLIEENKIKLSDIYEVVSLLHVASKYGRLDIFMYLKDNISDLLQRNNLVFSGNGFLHDVASSGNVEFLQYLIDENSEGLIELLNVGCANNHYSLYHWLLNYIKENRPHLLSEKVYACLLVRAVYNDAIEIFNLLILNMGANIDLSNENYCFLAGMSDKPLLDFACSAASVRIFKLLLDINIATLDDIQKREIFDRLFQIIFTHLSSQMYSMIELLINMGATPPASIKFSSSDKFEEVLILNAIGNRSPTIVKLLLKNSIKISKLDFQEVFSRIMSSVVLVYRRGNIKDLENGLAILKLLINATDKDEYRFFWLSKDFYKSLVGLLFSSAHEQLFFAKSIIKYLITKGEITADDLIDGRGNTLLHLAIRHNQPDVVSFLLQYGADVKRENQNGINAFGMTKSPDVTKMIFRQELLNFAARLAKRDADSYKSILGKIGGVFGIAYSAGEKKAAAEALIRVVFENEESAILIPHVGPLSQGELSVLYENLIDQELRHQIKLQ